MSTVKKTRQTRKILIAELDENDEPIMSLTFDAGQLELEQHVTLSGDYVNCTATVTGTRFTMMRHPD